MRVAGASRHFRSIIHLLGALCWHFPTLLKRGYSWRNYRWASDIQVFLRFRMHLHGRLGATFELHALQKPLFLFHDLSTSRLHNLGIDQAVGFLRDKPVVNVVIQVIPLRGWFLPMVYHNWKRSPFVSWMVNCLIYDRSYLEYRHTAQPNLICLIMEAWSRVVRRPY